jgi:hypothetical protein
MNESNLEGEIFSTLMLQNIMAISGGLYSCVISNGAGSVSAETYLFVEPYFVTQQSDQQVSVGSGVILFCDVEAFPLPDYLWQRVDGKSIRNGIDTMSKNLSIVPVDFGDEGEYYCNATARGRTATSRDILITGTYI